MLYWAAVFFIIAIIAAVFGFGGVAAAHSSIATILFWIFLLSSSCHCWQALCAARASEQY